MPKTLIVPVDGSEPAEQGLACARVLASKFEACDVLVLSVDVDDGERTRPYVDALLERSGGGAVRAECVTGDPAGEIVRSAQQQPDAVVCMTTRGHGRIAAPLLGSVATEVLRGIGGPVLLVGPQCDPGWWHEPPHLVACWAGDASDAILQPAQAWSTQLGMDLSLLCVFHPLDVPASVDPQDQFLPALAQLDSQHRPARTIDLHDDFPPGAIADYARELPATLLALTTHARAGLGRAVLGSVAMDVVHRSPCPVLVTRRRP
jgi:nucleotide-binding universal stress UspA family protein